MLPGQAPVVPGADQVRDLSPPVAITLLVVVGLAIILFYFGPSLAERIRKPPPATAAPATPPAAAVAAPAIDAANSMANEWISELRARNKELSDQLARAATEIAALRGEVEQLRVDLERERWRRDR